MGVQLDNLLVEFPFKCYIIQIASKHGELPVYCSLDKRCFGIVGVASVYP